MKTAIPSPSISPPASGAEERRGERRYDLDWLRIIAILLLLFYHSGMAFVAEWGWHLKNSETSEIFQEWMYFLSRWRMALLFFISGAGTWFVLKRASAGEYLWRRTLRLLVPLIFGMAVVVPPQIYMERLAQGVNFGNYLDFYPSVFRFEPYPQGSTSWHHLWFIAYLFIYSIAGLPLFLFLRSKRGRDWVQSQRLSAPVIYSFGLPMAVIFAALSIKFPGPQDIIHDWAMLLYYFAYFLIGYLFTVQPRFTQLIEEKRQTSLGLGCLVYILLCYFRWNDQEPPRDYWVPSLLFRGLISFNAWFWVLTLLGYGKRYLNRSNRMLAYANEAIYPFYILHQTVIVIIVYYVVRTQDTILLKFLFTSAASFFLTMVLYHFAVRPFEPLRFLFGMKAAGKEPTV